MNLMGVKQRTNSDFRGRRKNVDKKMVRKKTGYKLTLLYFPDFASRPGPHTLNKYI